jgi:DNA polymerase III epsilon subunit-like protein
MDRPIVAFDTETASLRGAPHLLELGALRIVDGEVVDTFESLVRPDVEIDPEATAFHGIGEGDVRQAPGTAEVLERFAAWVGDDWMAAHRAEADARVLGFEYARADLAPPPGPLLCTLRLARKAFPDAPNHRLETLCDHLGLEEGAHHRALPDAVWCWKVLEACAARLGSEASDGDADATAGAVRLLATCGTPITIAANGPALRRSLKPRLRALARAASDRARVRLSYGEGDAPATLSVTPRILFDLGDRSYLEAECGSTGRIKTYRLDRVHRVQPA